MQVLDQQIINISAKEAIYENTSTDETVLESRKPLPQSTPISGPSKSRVPTIQYQINHNYSWKEQILKCLLENNAVLNEIKEESKTTNDLLRELIDVMKNKFN